MEALALCFRASGGDALARYVSSHPPKPVVGVYSHASTPIVGRIAEAIVPKKNANFSVITMPCGDDGLPRPKKPAALSGSFDTRSGTSAGGRSEPQSSESSPGPGCGILRSHWVEKHQTATYGCIVVVEYLDGMGSKDRFAIETTVASHVERVKNSVRGRSTRIVLALVTQQPASEQPKFGQYSSWDDLVAQLRTRCALGDAKHCLLFHDNCQADWLRGVERLSRVAYDHAVAYHREEAVRIKKKLRSEKATRCPGFTSRIRFKVGWHFEAGRDPKLADHNYVRGYEELLRLPPVLEVIIAADVFMYRMLLLQANMLGGAKVTKLVEGHVAWSEKLDLAVAHHPVAHEMDRSASAPPRAVTSAVRLLHHLHMAESLRRFADLLIKLQPFSPEDPSIPVDTGKKLIETGQWGGPHAGVPQLCHSAAVAYRRARHILTVIRNSVDLSNIAPCHMSLFAGRVPQGPEESAHFIKFLAASLQPSEMSSYLYTAVSIAMPVCHDAGMDRLCAHLSFLMAEHFDRSNEQPAQVASHAAVALKTLVGESRLSLWPLASGAVHRLGMRALASMAQSSDSLFDAKVAIPYIKHSLARIVHPSTPDDEVDSLLLALTSGSFLKHLGYHTDASKSVVLSFADSELRDPVTSFVSVTASFSTLFASAVCITGDLNQHPTQIRLCLQTRCRRPCTYSSVDVHVAYASAPTLSCLTPYKTITLPEIEVSSLRAAVTSVVLDEGFISRPGWYAITHVTLHLTYLSIHLPLYVTPFVARLMELTISDAPYPMTPLLSRRALPNPAELQAMRVWCPSQAADIRLIQGKHAIEGERHVWTVNIAAVKADISNILVRFAIPSMSFVEPVIGFTGSNWGPWVLSRESRLIAECPIQDIARGDSVTLPFVVFCRKAGQASLPIRVHYSVGSSDFTQTGLFALHALQPMFAHFAVHGAIRIAALESHPSLDLGLPTKAIVPTECAVARFTESTESADVEAALAQAHAQPSHLRHSFVGYDRQVMFRAADPIEYKVVQHAVNDGRALPLRLPLRKPFTVSVEFTNGLQLPIEILKMELCTHKDSKLDVLGAPEFPVCDLEVDEQCSWSVAMMACDESLSGKSAELGTLLLTLRRKCSQYIDLPDSAKELGPLIEGLGGCEIQFELPLPSASFAKTPVDVVFGYPPCVEVGQPFSVTISLTSQKQSGAQSVDITVDDSAASPIIILGKTKSRVVVPCGLSRSVSWLAVAKMAGHLAFPGISVEPAYETSGFDALSARHEIAIFAVHKTT